VGEQRVSLIPSDVAKLIQRSCEVIVEAGAGTGSGFSDQDYQQIGAKIRINEGDFSSLFHEVDIIVRAKRPNREREIAESKVFTGNTIMIGALDPFETNSPHIEEYKQAKITAYSIDQLDLPVDNPMNILASMSQIAGKLALLDAMEKTQLNKVKHCVIIGSGVAGMAAIEEAIAQGLEITVIVTSENKATTVQKKGAQPIILSRDSTLEEQQKIIAEAVKDADIVITSARRPKQAAPILIPTSTLEKMKSGACIVDLALSEGGNVAGSHHDQTLVLGNHIIVTNVSGYPKAQPRLASKQWSRASLAFIELLLSKQDPALLDSAKVT